MKNFKTFIKKDQELHPSNLKYPCFLMMPPFNLSTDNPNNVFMKNIPEKDRKINKHKAMNQFINLYNYVASEALIYLLPHTDGLQDQIFTANLGVVLPHYDKGDTVVISEFRSVPRIKEQKPGIEFFKMMGYNVEIAPKYFEGEADLKYINENNYIGAYGIRTSIDALEWFEKKFNCNIIKVENKDEKLYHLDCLIFPLYSNKILAVTSQLSKENIKDIEKFSEIIDVPSSIGAYGITNCVGLNKTILCASNIDDLKVTDDDYKSERAKVDFLLKICSQNSFEPIFFNMSEIKKSGADLSCCVMHMNYHRLLQE